MRLLPTSALLASATLGLAACGGSNATVDQAATGNGYPVLDQPAGYANLTLTPDQQQRRDALDMNAYTNEYRSYVDQGPITVRAGDTGSGTAPPTGMGNSPANATVSKSSIAPSGSASGGMSGAMSNGQGATGPGSAQSGSMTGGANGMASRGAADASFAQLDRNSDGKLSVAEYAIYATGLNPTTPAPNDQTKPYATADQLNKAADGFFHFDTNGDTYLQPNEFAAARAATSAG